MQTSRTIRKQSLLIPAAVILLVMMGLSAVAQDRLPSMPGYDQYKKMAALRQTGPLIKNDWRFLEWNTGGKSFNYMQGVKRFTYTVSNGKSVESVAQAPATQPAGRPGMRAGERVDRGRQSTMAISPDGKLKAFYKDRNLWLSDADGKNVTAITTEGNEVNKLKFGSSIWVYGEELDQTTAMWWSPDNKKIAFYRFDESPVKFYYLQYKQLEIYDSVEVEAYTKVGAVNPVVDILVYDLTTKKTTLMDVRDGKPFENSTVGQYVYGIDWSPSGTELLFHRTNRKQNIMEYAAADPVTGKTRVIFREEWLPSYTKNSPSKTYLKDNNRFILVSERTGFKNFYLYDLSGKLLSTITSHPFEVANIVKIDEVNKKLYYMARDGDNHMKLQLHVVGLDGKGDKRLTDPAYNHSVILSPDYKYFIDNAQTHNIPPFTRLVDMKGKVLAELAKADISRFEELGLKKVELITFKAGDGVTDLHGMLSFPSNFDPSKKYPMIVTVYGGPETNAASENFATPNPMTEYGFLVASFDSRSASGRGKKFMDPYYGNLGIVEMDDQAEGVKSLHSRTYLNKEKVGITGTSYGGTAAATCLLRFPDVFHAAVANSAVTDWRNYDNIYTERHNGLVDENKAGYDAGSIMKYAPNLKGHLMIYYGTSDNNVHPANALQLIAALQRAGKSFEVQVGPDRGHTAVNSERMMEFFIENLVVR